MPFASIPEILEDVKHGRMIVLVDDEDRENEGDLIVAGGEPPTRGNVCECNAYKMILHLPSAST